MKPLENVWSGLVQRRLLPVAILLLAALVAVPVPAREGPGAGRAGAGRPPRRTARRPPPRRTRSCRSPTRARRGQARRRVLGARKNPFEPAAAPKVKATPTPDAGAAAPTLRRHRRRGQAGRLGHLERPGGSPGHVPGAPRRRRPPTPKPTYELYSLTVRFGDSSSADAGEAQPAAPEGAPVGRGPRARLPGPGQGRQVRGLHGRRGRRGAGRRRLQAEPAQLRDAPHARGRDRVLRRPRTRTAT